MRLHHLSQGATVFSSEEYRALNQLRMVQTVNPGMPGYNDPVPRAAQPPPAAAVPEVPAAGPQQPEQANPVSPGQEVEPTAPVPLGPNLRPTPTHSPESKTEDARNSTDEEDDGALELLPLR